MLQYNNVFALSQILTSDELFFTKELLKLQILTNIQEYIYYCFSHLLGGVKEVLIQFQS